MYLYNVKIEKIFVYGTLRNGGAAYHLMSGSKLLEEGITVTGFKLYDAGEYPFAFYTADPTDIITGDMFEINEGILISLDEYEGEDYRRKVLQDYDCYMYILDEKKTPLLPVIPGGDWLIYKK